MCTQPEGPGLRGAVFEVDWEGSGGLFHVTRSAWRFRAKPLGISRKPSQPQSGQTDLLGRNLTKTKFASVLVISI